LSTFARGQQWVLRGIFSFMMGLFCACFYVSMILFSFVVSGHLLFWFFFLLQPALVLWCTWCFSSKMHRAILGGLLKLFFFQLFLTTSLVFELRSPVLVFRSSTFLLVQDCLFLVLLFPLLFFSCSAAIPSTSFVCVFFCLNQLAYVFCAAFPFPCPFLYPNRLGFFSYFFLTLWRALYRFPPFPICFSATPKRPRVDVTVFSETVVYGVFSPLLITLPPFRAFFRIKFNLTF